MVVISPEERHIVENMAQDDAEAVYVGYCPVSGQYVSLQRRSTLNRKAVRATRQAANRGSRQAVEDPPQERTESVLVENMETVARLQGTTESVLVEVTRTVEAVKVPQIEEASEQQVQPGYQRAPRVCSVPVEPTRNNRKRRQQAAKKGDESLHCVNIVESSMPTFLLSR